MSRYHFTVTLSRKSRDISNKINLSQTPNLALIIVIMMTITNNSIPKILLYIFLTSKDETNFSMTLQFNWVTILINLIKIGCNSYKWSPTYQFIFSICYVDILVRLQKKKKRSTKTKTRSFVRKVEFLFQNRIFVESDDDF